MQPKHIIIAAIVGIVALAIFNVLNSHSRTEATPTSIEASSDTDTSSAPSLGEQPKAILDNVNNSIDAAEAQEADKLKQVDDNL